MLSQLADDLELLRRGKLSPAAFRSKHPFQSASPLVQSVLANIEHYIADADIRAKDQQYADMQDNEMQKLISSLRTGTNSDMLRSIDFLHES